MKSISIVLATFVISIWPAAGLAEDSFDYSQVQSLYVISGESAFAFGKYPHFLEFRELIAKKMAAAVEIEGTRSPVYTVRLVGVGEEATVFIGEDWVGDGHRTAELRKEDFEWINSTLAVRDESFAIDAKKIETVVRNELEMQKEPGWQKEN